MATVYPIIKAQGPAFLLSLMMALALRAGPAKSSDLPQFSIDHYCNSVAKKGGEVVLKPCLDDEQDAQTAMARDWSDFSERLQLECSAIARVAGGSYGLLQECIIERVAEGKWDDVKWK